MNLQNCVDTTVKEFQKPPSKSLFEALTKATQQPVERMLNELFSRIDAASEHYTLGDLAPTELMPDIKETQAVVLAVQHQDVEALQKIVQGGYEDLLAILFATLAQLEPAKV